MSLFGALDISTTGVDAMQTWINANAGNIANSEDAVSPGTTPYQEEVPQFAATSVGSANGEGVAVTVGTLASSGEVETDAQNPELGRNGELVYPDISLGDQLVGLVQAQEGYEADTSAITRAMSAYQAGLQIGS